MNIVCNCCGDKLKIDGNKVEMCSKCLEVFKKEAYDEGYYDGIEVAESDEEDHNVGWKKKKIIM